MRLSKRARLILAATLGVAVAASAAGLALTSRPGSAAAAASPGSTPPRADLAAMQSALNSGSVSREAALLVPGFRFAPGSEPIFPAGTKVTVEQATFRSDDRFGTVRATAGGSQVTLGLYAVGGHWRLYAIKPGTPAQTRAAVTRQPATAELTASVSSGTVKNCPDDTTDLGSKVPVVLIHGYTGHPSDWGSDSDPSSMFYAVDMIPGTWTSAFDYSGHNTDWVDNPYIGPRFVTYLNCLAATSKAHGGPGKVVVIAHSMGGLATRWAAAHGAADSIGEVITLGTPNTGSPLAPLRDSLRQLTCDGKSLLAVATFGKPGTSKDCTDYTALAGMTQYGSQITSLPELPGDIPLYAIAGDETVNSPLGGALITTSEPSDILVPADSALHQPPGASQFTTKTITCTATFPFFEGPCWHGRLPSNPAAEADVGSVVRTYVQAHYGPQPQGSAQGQQPLAGHPAGPDGNDPLNVVYGFYDALNAHDYSGARQTGIAVIGGTDEASFVHNQILQGNASAYVTGRDLTGGTGQEQPGESYEVQVSATVTWKDATVVKDGTVRHYAGTYIVRWDGSSWSITEVNPFQRTAGTGFLPSAPLTLHGVTRPSQVVFSGDATNVVDHLTWTGWGTAEATGTGTFEYDSCTPDCARATLVPYPAQVLLTDPAGGQYTRVSEVIESGPYAGAIENNAPVTSTWPGAS